MGMGLFCVGASAFSMFAGFLAYTESRTELAAINFTLAGVNALLAIANFIRAR